MKQKRISFTSIALLLIVGLIVLNLIGLMVYKNEIDNHLKKNISKEEITLDSLARFTPAEIDQKFDNALGASISSYFSSKQSYEDHIDEVKSAVDALFKIREAAYEDYKCVCDGTCGTGKIGRGSECERKEQKYLQASKEYLAAKNEFDSLQHNDETLVLEREEIQKKIDVFTENEIQSSYLERIVALWYLLFFHSFQ